MTGKKKLLEKLDNIKPSIQKIFEGIGVALTDDQLTNFISAFELLKEESMKEAILPIEAKMEGYQKRNYELQVKLEETIKNNDKLDKMISEKIEEVNKIKIPQIPDIEKIIDERFNGVVKLVEGKIIKLDEIYNKVNEKLIPFKLDEELKKIQDVAKLFENYTNSFVKTLCDTESEEIKSLHSKLMESESKLNELNKKIVTTEEQMKKEREHTQITLMLENSNLDKEEKDLLYKISEKFSFEETKNEIQKMIITREGREKLESKSLSRQLMEEPTVGIKPINDMGFIQKKKIFSESGSFKNQMDEWETLAFKDDDKKI